MSKIIFAGSQSAVDRACDELSGETLLGLDVETKPVGDKQHLCLVQLASRSTVYVLDVRTVHDPGKLKAILESETIEKVVHNASFETRVLAATGITLENVYDTMVAARMFYPQGTGLSLAAVCKRELDLEMDKTLQCSDWSARPLSEEQIQYAALDAEVLPKLYDIFNEPQSAEATEAEQEEEPELWVIQDVAGSSRGLFNGF